MVKSKHKKQYTDITIRIDTEKQVQSAITKIVNDNRDRLLRYESQRMDELFKSVNQLQKQVKTLNTKLARLEGKSS